jgi:hypothetical protein
MLAEDGSGKGAGLVSAIAQRINSRLAFDESHKTTKQHNFPKVNDHISVTRCVKVEKNGS